MSMEMYSLKRTMPLPNGTEMEPLLSTSILVSMRVTQTSIISNLGLVRKSSTLQNGTVFGQKPEIPIHPLDTEHTSVEPLQETVMHLLDEELASPRADKWSH